MDWFLLRVKWVVNYFYVSLRVSNVFHVVGRCITYLRHVPRGTYPWFHTLTLSYPRILSFTLFSVCQVCKFRARFCGEGEMVVRGGRKLLILRVF